jgi:tetratricopeptide (TPR) repeat protein
MSSKFFLPTMALIIICLIALIYWPTHLAGFVWDDKIFLHDAAWLRHGDSWKHFIFQNFNDWENYFRPLVVALFVAEVRIFDVAPGPMHLISLGLHLINTLLVGLLARSLFGETPGNKKRSLFAGVAMLVYGLHPVLIEPVAWIASQTELSVTLFMLLGLVLNTNTQHPLLRACAVATCFFLAAGAKESAVSFPPLLVLFDWMRIDSQQRNQGRLANLRMLWQRQKLVYIFVLTAGVAYLVLRHWALGFLVQPGDVQPLLSFARLQTVFFVYVTYWRLIVWPMVGLGPIHIVDVQQFATFSAASLATDFAAIALLFCGIYFAWKRKPAGYLIIAVTVALLPVLHIVPIGFDPSLYHERYAMTALAIACFLLPRTIASITIPAAKLRGALLAFSAITLVWLGLAVMNIRVTLPLWSSESKLWLWVLQEHPESVEAKNHLLLTYMELGDRTRARRMADMLFKEKQPCPMCMVNIANLALADGDLDRASTALEKAKATIYLEPVGRLERAFIRSTGQLRELKGDAKGAEEAYRDAITMGPLDALVRMNLALLLARQGKVQEAHEQANVGLSLLAPDKRAEMQKAFEAALAAPP